MSGSREAWGKIWGNCSQWCRQNTHIIKSRPAPPHPSCPKPWQHQDHWSQITVTNTGIMKRFETPWEWQKCDREMWREQMLLEKWCRKIYSRQGFHTPSVCLKKEVLAKAQFTTGLWTYIFLDRRTFGSLASFPTSITFIIKINFIWKTRSEKHTQIHCSIQVLNSNTRWFLEHKRE